MRHFAVVRGRLFRSIDHLFRGQGIIVPDVIFNAPYRPMLRSEAHRMDGNGMSGSDDIRILHFKLICKTVAGKKGFFADDFAPNPVTAAGMSPQNKSML